MAVLIAPNGVQVNASELDTPILLAAGYTRAEQKPEQLKRTRTRKKKVTTDEPTD